ncbi:hypothetical protein SAMN04490178_10484 [Propionispora vibrioides]|uniref:Uncharacterized protein n=1 Tax=Propionispora vibrioides TaxID=112903 RepID=A0A1H8RUN9_9FIRM|nr:hypothetical protein SAMN04490178_10484 [Propionispora vibrioides]
MPTDDNEGLQKIDRQYSQIRVDKVLMFIGKLQLYRQALTIRKAA